MFELLLSEILKIKSTYMYWMYLIKQSLDLKKKIDKKEKKRFYIILRSSLNVNNL